MTKRKFDTRAWARQEKFIPSRSCVSCSEPFVSTIGTVLDEIIEGRATVSTEAIWRMLVDNFDFPVGVSALRQHIRRHEAERWKKIRRGL